MKPRATYRLQFHKGFTFADATAQADYFAELGISHIYCSPILTARAGSLHGYDVVDHSRINPELGGEEGFRAMAHSLRERGLGLIVDIVPNHVAVGKADNAWWLDLLANGPASRYARAFDIDWDAPGLEGKVLAPFLGDAPQAALQKGDLKLVREDGRLAFAYYDHRFPLRAEDQNIAFPSDRADLQALLDRQHFVLAHWTEADARINWRRFFDITDLAAIRVAEPEVFEAVHAKIFALYADSLIEGVRVDHVDGLADPEAYCRTLRARLESLRPGAVIYVEKILADGESLPGDWEVDGTTGYDFLDEVSALLHREEDVLTRMWCDIRPMDFDQEESLARREILHSKFRSQLCATARAFAPLLELDTPEVEKLLEAILVQLRCYRSYATGKPGSPGAGTYLTAALEKAAGAFPASVAQLKVLFERNDNDPRVVDALRRFAQLSAPLAAKSVEDTAFYRYGRLLSRNDVGTNPRRHALSVAAFHDRMLARARQQPHAMLTTATHDHKRGEDARARLSVLSLKPERWWRFIQRLAPAPTGVHPADLYQLYQTLYAAWPAGPDEIFAERIQGWGEKFLREGKLRSSWSNPDRAYEGRFQELARDLILDPALAGFRTELETLLAELAPHIRAATIGQLILRNTVPGVPDLYQGCELEDLSLVDPDNRRPVDFSARVDMLRSEGAEKQLLLKRLLAVRRAVPALWRDADYQPKELEPGLAFARRWKGHSLLVCLPRSLEKGGAKIGLESPMRDILTGHQHRPGLLRQDDLFALYPGAVLYAGEALTWRGFL